MQKRKKIHAEDRSGSLAHPVAGRKGLQHPRQPVRAGLLEVLAPWRSNLPSLLQRGEHYADNG